LNIKLYIDTHHHNTCMKSTIVIMDIARGWRMGTTFS